MNITFEPNGPNDQSRILIVDNSSQFTRSARRLLEQTGNYVACAVNDPRRALETARSFKPDLVLVDLIMPQADGPEIDKHEVGLEIARAFQRAARIDDRARDIFSGSIEKQSRTARKP